MPPRRHCGDSAPPIFFAAGTKRVLGCSCGMHLTTILAIRNTALECREAADCCPGPRAGELIELSDHLLKAATDIEIRFAGHNRTPSNMKRDPLPGLGREPLESALENYG